MAKPRQTTLIKVFPPDHIQVWADQSSKEIKEIASIEGILYVRLIAEQNPIYITIDPRYNLEEIAAEIRELLVADVPDVFKE